MPLSLSPPCPLCSLWPSRRWASGLTQQSQLHRAHAPLARGSGPVWTPGDISLEGGGGIPSHPTPPPFLLSLGGKLWAYPNLPLPFLRNKGTNPWKIIYRLIDPKCAYAIRLLEFRGFVGGLTDVLSPLPLCRWTVHLFGNVCTHIASKQ